MEESRARKTTAKIQALTKQANVDINTGGFGDQKAYVYPEVLENSSKDFIDPETDMVLASDSLLTS